MLACKKENRMNEWITTQYEIPPSRWQEFLNYFRRLSGHPIYGGKVIITIEPKNPYGLLTDNKYKGLPDPKVSFDETEDESDPAF
jgi:hypothetical protein